MTIRSLFFALCLAVGGAFIVASPAALASEVSKSAKAPRIMVMLRMGPKHFHAGSSYGGDYGDTLGQAVRLRVASKIAHENGLTLLESWPMPMIGVDCMVMEVNDGRTVEDVVAAVSKLSGVAWSQPINQFEMQGAAPATYNDKLYQAEPAAMRWHISSLHRYATGRGQTIAIIDSRIDTSHPDLARQSIGIADFVPGKLRFAERHGTGVAGIIAARANNAIGIAGIAPDAHVLGLRACWERSTDGATVCDSLSLARAMAFALEKKADVINLSLTGPRDQLLASLISLGLSRGMTVVAAVDRAQPEHGFPASLAGVLPVTDDRLSARDSSVYIAPGRDIPTTEPEGKWSLVSGSSYAAAHVSGLAALLRQLSARRGIAATTITAMGPRGLIDACAAIARLSSLDAKACRASY
jgi:subtilisin family serine protease